MDIDELLNRYFEGETSSEEERELRAFFTSGNVPDRLAVYTPMFTYLEEESRKERPVSYTHLTLPTILRV